MIEIGKVPSKADAIEFLRGRWRNIQAIREEHPGVHLLKELEFAGDDDGSFNYYPAADPAEQFGWIVSRNLTGVFQKGWVKCPTLGYFSRGEYKLKMGQRNGERLTCLDGQFLFGEGKHSIGSDKSAYVPKGDTLRVETNTGLFYCCEYLDVH
jgi:hypothetical protein